MKQVRIILLLLLSIQMHGLSQIDNTLSQNLVTGTYVNYESRFYKKATTSDNIIIRGKRYWDNDWHVAIAKLKMGWVKIRNAKLDLFANEFHFLDVNGEEVVANKGEVEKMAFYDQNDSTKIVAVFEKIATKPDKSDSLSYVQILNDGEMQIVKKVKFQMVQNTYDPMVGKEEIRLLSDDYYFVATNGKLSLVGLTKSKLISMLSATKQYREWIRNHKLKSEDDIVAFLTYHEEQKKLKGE